MPFQYLKTNNADRISFITLNRAEKRNSLNYDVISELKVAFKAAINNQETKVVVLNALGEAFSAGADLGYLQQLQKNTFDENLEDSKHLMELFELVYTCPKVTIAAVQGHAIAGGCGLVTVCDYSFAVPEANFGFTEVKIGFIPALVMIYLLRRIGESKTREMLLSGSLYSAKEVQQMGLVNYLSAEEALTNDVNSFAKNICKSVSGQSIFKTKELLNKIDEQSRKEALNQAALMNAEMRSTDDCKRGIAAFLNKDKLAW